MLNYFMRRTYWFVIYERRNSFKIMYRRYASCDCVYLKQCKILNQYQTNTWSLRHTYLQTNLYMTSWPALLRPRIQFFVSYFSPLRFKKAANIWLGANKPHPYQITSYRFLSSKFGSKTVTDRHTDFRYCKISMDYKYWDRIKIENLLFNYRLLIQKFNVNKRLTSKKLENWEKIKPA